MRRAALLEYNENKHRVLAQLAKAEDRMDKWKAKYKDCNQVEKMLKDCKVVQILLICKNSLFCFHSIRF